MSKTLPSFLLPALLALAAPAAAQMPGGAKMPPAEVGVLEMQRQAIPRAFTLPGRAVAFEQVDIRPRVGGVITAILYQPGAPLAVGDPLFQLDDTSYQAEVASDEAALAAAEAKLPIARTALQRAERLETSGIGYTVTDVETLRSAYAEAQAALDQAAAALKISRTQAGWTTITSPIEGVADVAAVSVGDLVTTGQTEALTTVTRLDPVDVVMLEPSSRILAIREQIEAGQLKPSDTLKARLILENGQTYTGAGHLVAPGNTVSTTTGTVSVRFRFENPEGKIMPGMFLRGEVTIGTISAFLVPQRAATRSTEGTLTAYVVDGDSKARLATLSDIGTSGSNWIVTEGLEPGDRLILDRQKTMRPGMAVKPVPASLDADGLVVDQPAAAPAKPAGN